MARSAPSWPPEPPFELPPARTVHVPGRGEMFIRDSDPARRDSDPTQPVVMLLHGWIASADLNWCGVYGDLPAAGYRVLAIDHRGHGRGLRALEPFTLSACAADAAGVLKTLGVAPAIVVGYSMGGAIAQLVARDHADAVSGLVLSATAQHWKDPETRRVWRAMGAFGVSLSIAPRATWRSGLQRIGMRESRSTVWLQSELMRHSARDIAEAGRELGRFDSRPWAGAVRIPTAVVVTARDGAVRPSKQRELAAAFRATVFEAPIRHLEIVVRAGDYNPVLLEALASVSPEPGVKALPDRPVLFGVSMRRARIIAALTVFTVTLLSAAPAWAGESGGGQGWYGETNDKVITNAMFIVIAFFPTLILILSLIQWRLDKRKHARMDAAKRRAANQDWRGGW